MAHRSSTRLASAAESLPQPHEQTVDRLGRTLIVGDLLGYGFSLTARSPLTYGDVADHELLARLLQVLACPCGLCLCPCPAPSPWMYDVARGQCQKRYASSVVALAFLVALAGESEGEPWTWTLVLGVAYDDNPRPVPDVLEKDGYAPLADNNSPGVAHLHSKENTLRNPLVGPVVEEEEAGRHKTGGGMAPETGTALVDNPMEDSPRPMERSKEMGHMEMRSMGSCMLSWLVAGHAPCIHA